MTSDDLHDLLRQPEFHPHRFDGPAPMVMERPVVHRLAAPEEPGVGDRQGPPGDRSWRPADDATWLTAGIVMAWSLVVSLGVGAIVVTSIALSTALAALVTGVVAVGICAGSFAVGRALQ